MLQTYAGNLLTKNSLTKCLSNRDLEKQQVLQVLFLQTFPCEITQEKEITSSDSNHIKILFTHS